MDRTPATLPAAFPSAQSRALDGHTELAVAEAVLAATTRPAKVTAIIAAMYERLNEGPADNEKARCVSAAGREWLLQRAALRFHGAGDWFETSCADCGANFDLTLSIADIPCVDPGAGFPKVEVQTSLGRREFEVPNGAHEEAFARIGTGDPRRVFAALCGLSEHAEAEAVRFSLDDLERIDTALEAASPDVADSVDACCPECGSCMQVRIDPLTFAFPRYEEVLQDVHLLASGYQWSEREILDLPLNRRRQYAELIRVERRSAYPVRRR